MSKILRFNAIALTAERLKALQVLVRLASPSPSAADPLGPLWPTLVAMGLAERRRGRPTLYAPTAEGQALGGASAARRDRP